MHSNYKSLLILFTFFLQGTLISYAQPSWQWAGKIGGTLNDYGQAVAIDASENSYSTGSFQGTVDFDPGIGNSPKTSAGDIDIFITKLDNLGNFVWAKAIGGTNTDEGLSIVCDLAGYIYVTGYFQGTVDFNPDSGVYNLTSAGNFDVFIAKYDYSGNFKWAKRLGGTGIEESLSIALDHSGNIYTTGYFSSTADFDPDSVAAFNLTSAGIQDIFVSKLNASGNFVWAKSMGGSGSDHGLAVCVDDSGNVFSTGYFVQTADLDPGIGTYNVTSNGASDIYISKLDSTGNFSWVNVFGKSNNDRGYAIASDASGNVYTTGNFSGTVDFDPDSFAAANLTSSGSGVFISKLNNSGSFIWAKAISSPGSGSAQGRSIIIDPANNDVFNIGSFSDSTNFDPGITDYKLGCNGVSDFYISKFDASGNFNWAISVGGTNFDLCTSASLSPSGNLYFAGTFSSPTLAFGTTILTNTVTTGFPEIFIARLDNVITGVNKDFLQDKLLLFPNPAADKFTIAFPDSKNYHVQISGIRGNVIYQSTMNNLQSEINVQNYSNGIYLVKIISDNYIVTKKLVKSK